MAADLRPRPFCLPLGQQLRQEIHASPVGLLKLTDYYPRRLRRHHAGYGIGYQTGFFPRAPAAPVAMVACGHFPQNFDFRVVLFS
jgi:hypothetical protein